MGKKYLKKLTDTGSARSVPDSGDHQSQLSMGRRMRHSVAKSASAAVGSLT